MACLGFFLIVLDASVVNVALPAMGEELAAGLTGLQWIVDGYTLPLAGLIVVAGAGADRFGAARMFRWGLAGFGITSALCAVAPILPVLVSTRVLQGVAGAVVLPSSMAVAAGAFGEPALRQKVLGWWAAGGGVAVAAGPVIGGGLVDLLGWRAIFLVNVPVAVVGALLVKPGPAPAASAVRRLDLVGQAYLVACMAFGVYALIEAGHRDRAACTVLGVALFVVALVAVVRRARSGSPAIPVDQLRRPGVLLAVLTGAALNITFFGVVFALSLMLQQRDYLPAAVTGLVLLPASAVIVVTNLLASRSMDHRGVRWTLIAGLFCEAMGFLQAGAVLALVPGDPGWWLAIALLPAGAGAGLASPAMMTILMNATDPTKTGFIAGFLNGGRQAGTAIGVAAAGTLEGCIIVCVLAGTTLVINAVGALWHTPPH